MLDKKITSKMIYVKLPSTELYYLESREYSDVSYRWKRLVSLASIINWENKTIITADSSFCYNKESVLGSSLLT